MTLARDIHIPPEVGVGLEVLHQGCLIDDGAAGGVDQHRVLLHDGQPLLVDQVVRVLVQVAVDADHLLLLRINTPCVSQDLQAITMEGKHSLAALPRAQLLAALHRNAALHGQVHVQGMAGR